MRYEQSIVKQGADSSAFLFPLEDGERAVAAPQAVGLPKEATPPFRPPNGTFFDPAIGFREPEGDAITREVMALIAAVEKRKRKLKQTDERNRYALVRAILANGFRCHFYRHPSLVAYSRRAEKRPDDPVWLSGRIMGRLIDHLTGLGLLDGTRGEYGVAASTYAVTETLAAAAQHCGVTESSLTIQLPPERLVRLREGNSETPLIAFEPTDETERWTALLGAYNAFLAQQDIRIELSEGEQAAWVKHRNDKRRKEWWRDHPALCHPELFQTDLYRQFNHGSFEQGGRLYGGWWINTPSHLRRKIRINGKPTVELDYSGCAIRMLYHERGIDYTDDPYFLEEIASYEQEKGLPAGHFRHGIKAMTQALINDRSGGRPEQIELPDLSFKPGFTRPEVRRMIEDKHAPIADAFGTGAGLFLQRKDSDLALSIITELQEREVVVLPIHDSYIATKENEEALFDKMNQVYKSMFGYIPIIK